LTSKNLEALTEESKCSTCYTGSEDGESRAQSVPRTYAERQYIAQNQTLMVSRTNLPRRHTEFDQGSVIDPPPYELTPPTYTPTPPPMPALPRAYTMPQPVVLRQAQVQEEEEIDMHLAYGELPPMLPHELAPVDREAELKNLTSKIENLIMEAQCIQHTASTIITSLQKNPEAMAAVALTLAEISNVVTKLGPGILTALKGSSPAVFALLASPQFLIAGGVAVGVTIVMFGGYKIIKKVQKEITGRKEANAAAIALQAQQNLPEEALPFEPDNYSNFSIETWRRGIAEVETESMGTSVDGEFITPAASRIWKERIRERAREERSETGSERSRSTHTIRRKPVAAYAEDSRTIITESARTERTSGTRRTSDSRKTSKTSKTDRTEKTERSSKTHRSSKTVKSERSDSTVKPGKDKDKKVKKPSAFGALFKGSSTISTK
jgi:hypothetical protein